MNPTHRPSHDFTGIALIVVSSALLGIWATMNTIALRNVLLALGGVVAVVYWIQYARSVTAARMPIKCLLTESTPLLLIGLFFCWILFHYIFLSIEPIQQFRELSSTWLRSFVATLIGSATGLALLRNKRYMPLMWLGLILSFIVLIFQYIPKALHNRSMFAIDFLGGYIYWAKFSGVLAGAILLSGLIGLWIDTSRQKISGSINKNLFISIYAGLGIGLVLYAFVFIFDAKNGVGLTAILFCIWGFVGLVYAIRRMMHLQDGSKRLATLTKLVVFVIATTFVAGWFALKHVKNNPGWESLFADIYVSAQIDKYKNWQNTPKYGFPIHENGQAVKSNTYERVSWAVAGARLLGTYPLGYGTLRSFPKQMKAAVPDFNGSPYTHSAWIDIGLTFGLPGLFLIVAAILILLGKSLFQASATWRATVFTLSITILILYAIGEYGFQHGIEILFYVCGLMGGLSLIKSAAPFLCNDKCDRLSEELD